MKLKPDVIAHWREQGAKIPGYRSFITPEEWKELCGLAMVAWYMLERNKEPVKKP